MEKVRMTIALVVSVIVLGACGKGIDSPDGSLRADVKGQTIDVFFNGFGGGDGGVSVTGAAGGDGGASVVGVAGVTGGAGVTSDVGVAGVAGGDGKGKGVSGGGKVLATSVHVGLVTSEADLDSSLVLKKVSGRKKVVDDYEMVAGKRKHCHNEAWERVYSYRSPDGNNLDVILRVYNDGVAIRYVVPDGAEVTEDRTAYTILDGTKRWISPLKTDYESFFPLATDGGPTKERMWPRPAPGSWAYPALFEPAAGLFALICEADLRPGDSASTLDNSKDNESYQVHLTGPTGFHNGESPWRTVIVGSLQDIVGSTLVTDLSSPSEFEPDWVHPGVSSWVYWAYNHGSKEFNLDVEYIDLAADMGWPYCLVDWEWPQMVDGDIEELIDYAKEKGVKINLWYNSGTSWIGEGAPQPQDRLLDPDRREQELSWLEGLGVSGIKVDFFLPDNAEMVDYYQDILRDAARHHLLVDFHGCTIPRGWQRTWPNLMSMESVYGAEWYNNGPVMTTRAASHNATLPFTRNVVGPMDYTPGTFSDSQNPHITTYAHELALPILFESGLQHMPDRPYIYYSLPGEVRTLLSSLPSVWDDTVLLAGYPGEFAVLARRNAGTWYIAGINGKDEPCTIDFPVDVIAKQGEILKVFRDGAEDREFQIEDLTADGRLSIPCRARGGFVLVKE